MLADQIAHHGLMDGLWEKDYPADLIKIFEGLCDTTRDLGVVAGVKARETAGSRGAKLFMIQVALCGGLARRHLYC
jgi:hypothetical protein